MKLLVYVLFVASGACGLVYEVVWSRVMTQIFGSTVLAVGTVLAAFMSGLALGSYALGRLGDRSRNPLRVYAGLEIGIAATAVLSMALMDRTAALYVRLLGALGGWEPLLAAGRFLFAFGLVLLPTCLMGATLPILARYFISRLSGVGSGLSTLYALNTAGAVAGALLAGFRLIPRLGIHGSIHLAAAGNLAIGAIALLASRLPAPSPEAAPPPRAGDGAASGTHDGYRMVLWGFGLSGFASFAYEIFWTRSLVHLLGNSTYAFTMMLTAFLSGVALGGYGIRFLLGRAADRIRWFGGLQLAIGVSAAAVLPALFAVVDSPAWRQMIERASGGMGSLMVSRFAVALAVMLVPTTLIGATFPLVGSIFVRDLRLTAREVGKVYAANTVGNVGGALAPGFLLLPAFGIQRGILVVASLNVALGLFVLLARSSRLAAYRFVVPAMPAAVAAVLAGSALPFQFPSEFQKPTDRVLYYREGLAGTTKVFEDRDTGAKRMSIDGIVIGGTEFTDYKQQVLAHLPKVILEEYRTELSIGLGSGILIGESLRHPGLRHLVCVEIEPSVVEGAAHFAAENHGVLEDPRAEIVIDDVADFLRTHPERYDIISADEKTADRYASNGFSFSSDYYELLREHLTDRGLVIQWLANQLPASQYRMVLATFAASFPEVRLLYLPAVDKGGPVNTFLIGSLEPLSLDPTAMNERLRREPAAFEGWRRYGIESAEAILAHYVADGPPVRTATAGAPRNSLEYPLYEFYSPREYAVPLNERVLRNHEFLMPLRAAHGPAALAAPDEGRLASAARAEAEFLNGLALQLAGSPHGAILGRYDRAVEIAPWNGNLRSQVVSYLWNAAGVRYLAGDVAGALPLLAEAARLLPGHGEVRYYHGLALLGTGAEGRGLEEMRTAVALRPRLLPPRRVLASALGRRGDLDAAAAQLEAILEIDPDDLFALVTYANLLAEGRSRPAQARPYVERAARIAPADPAVIDLRAWVAYLDGDRTAARRIVREGGSYYEGNPLYEGRRSRILE